MTTDTEPTEAELRELAAEYDIAVPYRPALPLVRRSRYDDLGDDLALALAELAKARAVLARTPAEVSTRPEPGVTTARVNALDDGTTAYERQDATALLDALLAAADTQGVDLRIFDAVVDLPRVCLDAVRARNRARA